MTVQPQSPPAAFLHGGKPLLQTRSLREQVYDYLRGEMARGGMQPGAFLDLNALAARLGISRTPLRDALLQLEVEGFVEILPRRGFRLKPLGPEEIRNLYEIVGALESAALVLAGPRIGREGIEAMHAANAAMREAVEAEDFERFYAQNLAFHAVFLHACGNPRLVALADSLKQRLYDWPRRRGMVKDWEARSVLEHARLLELLEQGDYQAAAAHQRDVHWSYAVQEAFLKVYYAVEQGR